MNHGAVFLIMAGGAGTRFWPWSTDSLPKQFLQFLGERSLLQESYARVRDLSSPDRILVLTHENYRGLVAQQLPELPQENIVCEPSRRDTAAAAALGALTVARRFGNPVVVTLTSDHWIQPLQRFHLAMNEAIWGAASAPCLYTLGIKPTYPATGFGYLQLGEAVAQGRALPHRQLLQFKEKPPLEVAEQYLASGNYLWNSGMFAWQNEVILNQFRRHLPAHLEHLAPAVDGRTPLAEAFNALQKISVDFAILERAEDVRCVEPDFEWGDLGGWLALQPFLAAGSDGNSARGRCYAHDAENNLVVCADPDETVALLGVSNLVVVRVGRRTLVIPRERTEEIKALLASMPAEELK